MVIRNTQPPITTTIGGISRNQEVLNGERGNGDMDNITPLTPSGQTPSYLKLSCALSGYSNYKSYSSPSNVASSNVIPDNSSTNRTRASPKPNLLSKLNDPVPPSELKGGEIRTSDYVDCSTTNYHHTDRKVQSLSAGHPPKIKPEIEKARNSADYRVTSQRTGSITNDSQSHEENIIQNGPIRAFCENDDVVLGRDDNCDKESEDNVEVVSTIDTTTHIETKANTRTIPKLHIETDINTTELVTHTKVSTINIS